MGLSSKGGGERTNVGVEFGIVEVLDNGLDGGDCAVGLEVSAYEEFACLFLFFLHIRILGF